jgi:hypothetical protein
MFGTNGEQRILAGAIDHRETYGGHVLEIFVKDLSVQSAVDLGAGTGVDLAIVKTIHLKRRTIAVEAMALSCAIHAPQRLRQILVRRRTTRLLAVLTAPCLLALELATAPLKIVDLTPGRAWQRKAV